MPCHIIITADKIINTIDSKKDVDGLTDINAGRLMHNQESLVPCTPMGIMTLLEYYGIELEGKHRELVLQVK